MNEVTIIVNTCDDYEDVWELFFCAFQEYWPGCKYQIVLNTESKNLCLDRIDLRTHNFDSIDGKDIWGLRLKQTLNSCDSKYVIMLYDDFILEGRVDQEKICKCIEWLDDNKNIAAFYFTPNLVNINIDDNRYDGFELVPRRGEYTLSSGPAIWRRERLINYIGDTDNPWAWEFFGSYRTYRSTDLFYFVKGECEEIYPYSYSTGGAVYRGKWVGELVLPLIEKYNLHIDVSKRGLADGSRKDSKRSVLWKMKMFMLGFKMIGFGVFLYVYRILKNKLRM